jgi:hypothetical protein
MTHPRRTPFPVAALLACVLLAGCGDKGGQGPATEASGRDPTVTISGDEAVVVPAWQPAPVQIAIGDEPKVLAEANAALDAGKLFGGDRDAMPLLLELHARLPDDPDVSRAHARAVAMLIAEGETALASMDTDPNGLRHAHEVGEVGRTAAADAPAVRAFLSKLDAADASVQLDHRGERELEAPKHARTTRARRKASRRWKAR